MTRDETTRPIAYKYGTGRGRFHGWFNTRKNGGCAHELEPHALVELDDGTLTLWNYGFVAFEDAPSFKKD